MRPEVFENSMNELKKATEELMKDFDEFYTNPEYQVGSPEYFSKAYELQRRNSELKMKAEYLNNYLEKLKGGLTPLFFVFSHDLHTL